MPAIQVTNLMQDTSSGNKMELIEPETRFIT
jgi:hypothetical protein